MIEDNDVFEKAPLKENERQITIQECFLAKRENKPVIARIKVINGTVDIEHGFIIGGRARHGYTDKDPTFHEVHFKRHNDRRHLPIQQITIEKDDPAWLNLNNPGWKTFKNPPLEGEKEKNEPTS